MLNLKGKSEIRQLFETQMHNRIIGQDDAIVQVGRIFEKATAYMNDPNKPLGSILQLGPPGSGKTLTAESTAEILHGDPAFMLKISCGEFTESHQVARLIGAPPGYIGHNDTEPLITEASLTRGWVDKGPKVSVVLFDEIEKANETVHKIMLGILDKGELTTGKNVRIDMSRCLIFLTSNIGSRTINAQQIGFRKTDPKTNFAAIESAVIAEAKKAFFAEFIDRLSEIIVYRPLSDESKERILDIEIRKIWWRGLRAITLMDPKFENSTFTLAITRPLRKTMLEESYEKGSARKLKAVVEKYIGDSISRILASKQIYAPGTLILGVESGTVFADFKEQTPGEIVTAIAEAEPEVEPSDGWREDE